MNTKYFFKRTTIAAAALVLFLLAGCKKYLEQQPITDVSTEVVFADVASTYKALAGVYSRLVGDAGFGIRLSLYYTVDNDEMQAISKGHDDYGSAWRQHDLDLVGDLRVDRRTRTSLAVDQSVGEGLVRIGCEHRIFGKQRLARR